MVYNLVQLREDDMVLLGKRIRDLRTKYNLTQAELASQVGVSKATITAYEGDMRLPSYDVLIKLANVFRVSIDSLILNRSEYVLDVSDLNPEQINRVKDYIRYIKEDELLDILRSSEKINWEEIEKLKNKWNHVI